MLDVGKQIRESLELLNFKNFARLFTVPSLNFLMDRSNKNLKTALLTRINALRKELDEFVDFVISIEEAQPAQVTAITQTEPDLWLTPKQVCERLNAFIFSLTGAAIAEQYSEGKLESAKNLLSGINGVDDESIDNACELAAFDNWVVMPPIKAIIQSACEVTFPDFASTEIIRMLVERSVDFFTRRNPVIRTGYIFAPPSPACSAEVDSGVIDFLTADAIWDMKCYRPSTKISKDDTLQVLMYWIMGQHSGQEIFKPITKIGLFNPRMNTAYVLDVSKIPAEVIRDIEDKVICYGV